VPDNQGITFLCGEKDLSDTPTKAKFYPQIAKDQLIAEGYIA
jgi:hypothetical protein